MSFSFISCSKYDSNSEENQNVEQDFFNNKSQWLQTKSTINQYQLIESHASMFGHGKRNVIIDATSDTVVSCIDEYTATFGAGGTSATTTTDCSADSYRKTIEQYYEFFSNLIAEDNVSSYSFDPKLGIPLFVRSHYDSSCGDCEVTGFDIEFKILSTRN
ncbi:hypothetical protein K2X05_14795 [bacterium]|nr:hypothetical protein [bacterium]